MIRWRKKEENEGSRSRRWRGLAEAWRECCEWSAGAGSGPHHVRHQSKSRRRSFRIAFGCASGMLTDSSQQLSTPSKVDAGGGGRFKGSELRHSSQSV